MSDSPDAYSSGIESQQNHKGLLSLDSKMAPHQFRRALAPTELQLHLMWRGAMCSWEQVCVRFVYNFWPILQNIKDVPWSYNWRALPFSAFVLLFEASRSQAARGKIDSGESRKGKTMSETDCWGGNQDREREKRRDGIIDLSSVLSAWLIFVFHCFRTSVIWVKVIRT